MVDFQERKAGRSREVREMELCTFVTLTRLGRKVEIRTEFENTAKDHRLRVIIPTGIEKEFHYADSVFEVVKRPNRHRAGWKNPSGCEHQQYVSAVCDEKGGIAVANKGLYEYEVLPAQENALAVTLLRSVGEMGDWGVFPTPEAQCPGKQSAEYELIFSMEIFRIPVHMKRRVCSRHPGSPLCFPLPEKKEKSGFHPVKAFWSGKVKGSICPG